MDSLVLRILIAENPMTRVYEYSRNSPDIILSLPPTNKLDKDETCARCKQSNVAACDAIFHGER
ncbi:hypothetical protein NQ318_008709 [Aromia moschata]|uniref:DNA-directed RNA polymerase n=1 Tax=Aromia moschata TaxID=1265417 RepID=A0AAV8XAW0_9CUCU|nr:hypothetical protein NQ318_008709 [Aromia moschata]